MRISVWSADVCSSDFEQPPHGALRHLHPVLPLQVPDDLRKRDVALSFDQPQGLRSVSLEVVRAVISALRAGLKVARPLPLIDPLDRRPGRYPKALRRRAPGHSVRHPPNPPTAATHHKTKTEQ